MRRWIFATIALLIILQSNIAFAANDKGNYIAALENRYQRYAAKHPEMEYADAVVAVNLKLDEGNYENVLTATKPDSLEIFVSKHYALPRKYKPENLVSVGRKYAQGGVTLREDCYSAFLSLAQDMEKEGLTLYIKSGYRTNTKRGGANSGWYAWPGHSEHQTGLAFDLRKKNVTYETMWEYKYHKTDEYAWLCENAYKYGFILSYPEGASNITGFNYEPWHWRYIGVEIATDMKEKGFTTYHTYWATYKIQDSLHDYA
ncbi:MAG: M15 family metallopeptidase [Candidatus Pelethousia sp.]|nr:M15 family metallopeptidase [Candidatus Pelethousia sp.]